MIKSTSIIVYNIKVFYFIIKVSGKFQKKERSTPHHLLKNHHVKEILQYIYRGEGMGREGGTMDVGEGRGMAIHNF